MAAVVKKTVQTPSHEEIAKNDDGKNPSEEERISLLESRVLGVEQLCGLPNPTIQKGEKIRNFIVFQVYHKLLIFGDAAVPIALIVLLSSTFFVVGISIHQMRHTCTPNTSLIDGDLPAFVNQLTYRDSGNIFNCTSGSNNFLQQKYNDKNETHAANWSPCTPAGLSVQDYDMKTLVCPIAFNGCYRHPATVPTNIIDKDLTLTDQDTDVSKLKNGGMVEVCETHGWEETICTGVVSITYLACPNALTTIGAALGYTTLIQSAMLFVVLIMYLLFKYIMTGKCYTLSDISEAWGQPGSTIQQVQESKMLAKVEENDSEIGDRLEETETA